MKVKLKARPCDAPWQDYVKPEGTKEHSGMIDVIREILGTKPEVTPAQSLTRELELRQSKSKDYKPHNVAGDKYKDCGSEEIFAILKREYQAQADAYEEKEKKHVRDKRISRGPAGLF